MNNHHQPSSLARVASVLLCALLSAAALSCRSRTTTETEARGIVIVNAPAAGQVRRVLAREGLTVREGDPLFEIVVRTEQRDAPPPASEEDPQARAGRTVRAAQGEIEAARAEVVRFEVEVARLAPLVASGQASQGELDGARASYERAQMRLRQAQESAQSAQTGLSVARQQARSTAPAAPAAAEQVVTARASSAGTVSVVNTRVGEQVTAGQPLATLRAAP